MGLLDYFFDEVFDTFWLPSCELLNKLLIQEIDVNFFCHGRQIVPFLSFWTATNSKNSRGSCSQCRAQGRDAGCFWCCFICFIKIVLVEVPVMRPRQTQKLQKLLPTSWSQRMRSMWCRCFLQKDDTNHVPIICQSSRL